MSAARAPRRLIADATASPDIRISIGPDHLAFAGTVAAIGRHRLAAPAVLVGLERPLKIRSSTVHTSRAVLLAAGFSHAVDTQGGRIAVFFLPPHLASNGALPVLCDLPHVGEWLALAGAVLQGTFSAFDPVEHMLGRSQLGLRPVEERLRAAIAVLAAQLDQNISIEEAAAAARLSPSRLMALASNQLGTSLRRYRGWLRTFEVARHYAAGASLTHAALAVGFSSSAHLSAAVRDYFGIRPSQVLTPATRSGISSTQASSGSAFPSARTIDSYSVRHSSCRNSRASR